jgi:hypothetical protein
MRQSPHGQLRYPCGPSSLASENLTQKVSRFREERLYLVLADLRSFEAGRRALHTLPNSHRDLLHLALLGAAMDCCNAERDGECLRYKTDWRFSEAAACQFRQCFRARTDAITTDLVAMPLTESQSCVIEGDARRLLFKPPREKFRLCVTSPPYLNSFDYSDVYRPELFLGGFVDSAR